MDVTVRLPEAAVRAVREGAEVAHRMDDRAGTAILAPFVEGADLLPALVGVLSAFEHAVLGVVVRRVLSPVGIDIVPVVDHECFQLVGQRKAFG